MKVAVCFLNLFFGAFLLSGQQKEVKMSLEQCIDWAVNHSLQALRVENDYMSGQWDYLNYKAGRLPSLSLRLNPVQYNSHFTSRYDYTENIDVYRQQQLINSSAGLSMTQSVGLTGGRLTLDSDLNFMRNFGDNLFTQYSSVPVRIGYSQSLFGFNYLKWTKKIEPLRYEKVSKQYLYAKEATAETAIRHFFDLASAQSDYAMALENIASTDTLYIAGREKNLLGVISEADLLTLELDLINADNALENAITQLELTTSAFFSFFGLDKNSHISLELPDMMPEITVSAEEAFFQMKENNPDILRYRQQALESEQSLEQMQKTGGLDANVSASVGFNQAGNRMSDVYNHLLRQDIVNISVTVPLVDWGTRKRRISAAKNNRAITQQTIEQDEFNLEQELTGAVSEFNRQYGITKKSLEALQKATAIYEVNKQRFIIGKTDANTLTLSQNRKDSAMRNYISALNRYWSLYYTIRKLTLYDFAKREKLSIVTN